MARWTNVVKKGPALGGCWYERHGTGDHEIWFSPISNKRFPVDQKILSRHTANEVMRQAGMPHRFR